MVLQVIGTGSSGNAYLLKEGNDMILLEAGLRWRDMLRAFPDGIRGIQACLITHEHKDHCKSAENVMRLGISTVMSAGTFRELGIGSQEDFPSLITAGSGDVVEIASWRIIPVKAMHDAVEPLAFLLMHLPTQQTVLYATDTYMLPNRYPGINYWLVECNFVSEKAEELLQDTAKAPLYDRLMKSHMSLERLLTALEENDLSNTKKIVLVHISQERGDNERMKAQVQAKTGITTEIAENGKTITLTECPF